MVGSLRQVSPANAQVAPEGGEQQTETQPAIQPDTVAPGSAAPDSVMGSPPSPLGAFGRSILVPGWGQLATGHPVRGAFYFASEAAAIVMVFNKQSELEDARAAVPPDSSLVAAKTRAREDWIVAAAFVALLSGVDAWVSAHFWGFQGQIVQPPDGALGLEYQVRVPVNWP